MTFVLFAVFVFSMARAIAGSVQEIAIESAIKSQWGEPNNPLSIDPIVVVNEYAIAGWSQGIKGGRALLKQNTNRWQVLFCGDSSIKHISVLEQAGLSHVDAIKLSNKLQGAEEKISSDHLSLLDTFKGITKVDAQHHQQEC